MTRRVLKTLLFSIVISLTGCADDALETIEADIVPEDIGDPADDVTAPPPDVSSVDTALDTVTPPDDSGPDPLNNAPVATDDMVTAMSSPFSIQIDVLLNDSDPDFDGLRIVEVTQGLHGVAGIVNNGLMLEYTSLDLEYVGVDTFGYTVTDDNGGEDSATVTLNITAIPTLTITSPAEGEVISGDAVTIVFEVTGCNFTHPSNDSAGCHGHRFVDEQGWQTDTEGTGQYEYAPFTLTPLK